ncbi:hypothetical protein ACRALDRAFT_209361 [Sodiomyces alcalophilus JCM 7366]|uniref:uncharacterized protein n=1 Tax=Sodiomyces alcalophilus JCM 7366 TaxID=591952 RepID=UPI0039B4347F
MIGWHLLGISDEAKTSQKASKACYGNAHCRGASEPGIQTCKSFYTTHDGLGNLKLYSPNFSSNQLLPRFASRMSRPAICALMANTYIPHILTAIVFAGHYGRASQPKYYFFQAIRHRMRPWREICDVQGPPMKRVKNKASYRNVLGILKASATTVEDTAHQSVSWSSRTFISPISFPLLCNYKYTTVILLRTTKSRASSTKRWPVTGRLVFSHLNECSSSHRSANFSSRPALVYKAHVYMSRKAVEVGQVKALFPLPPPYYTLRPTDLVAPMAR